MSAVVEETPSETIATLKAPFPWFGGKSRVARLVWDRFGNVPNYVEPFAGSLAVLLGRESAPRVETVNDIDCWIANFWRALQSDPESVATYADWPVNECCPAGTMIATPEGDIPIEQIKPGMTVLGEHNGQIVETVVIDTTRSVAEHLSTVGPLRLTGNHPVWTAEKGYLAAEELTHSATLCLLKYGPHEQAVGDICTGRSAHKRSPLRRNNVSKEVAVQRAPIAGKARRHNSPGFLDSLSASVGSQARQPNFRGRKGRRLARSRALLDLLSQNIEQPHEPFGRGRRDSGGYPFSRVAREMVPDAQGRAVLTRTGSGYARQAPHTRSQEENKTSRNRTSTVRLGTSKIVGITSRENPERGTQRQNQPLSLGQSSLRRTQAEDRRKDSQPPTRVVRRNKPSLRLSYRSLKSLASKRGVDLSSAQQGEPLQGKPLPAPVSVYNFQTATGNYFADSVLVHNCDLHARHLWLVNQVEFRERMKTDPDYFDAKIAGWWCWGICQWIGSGWCAQPGWRGRTNAGRAARGIHAVEPDDLTRKRVRLSGFSDVGVHKKMPYAGRDERGALSRTAAKRPRLGRGQGRGVSRQIPKLSGDSGASGSGVHSGFANEGLLDWLQDLAARLRRVRVCCGDWTRVLGPSVTHKIALTGVFLDPPYDMRVVSDKSETGRDGAAPSDKLYEHHDNDISSAVREWAIENGENPLLRIAVCGYEGEHEFPSTWSKVAWKANGGFGNQNPNTNGAINATRERIWFSPSCLIPQPGLFT